MAGCMMPCCEGKKPDAIYRRSTEAAQTPSIAYACNRGMPPSTPQLMRRTTSMKDRLRPSLSQLSGSSAVTAGLPLLFKDSIESMDHTA
jgi:hypothetical protein